MADMEKVGKITLDYNAYSGTDLYSDGDVEDELLELAKSGQTYEEMMEAHCKWPVVYHFSPARETIMDWFPIGEDASVLEIGSGCGAITGVLAEKAGKVSCIELSKKRSLINAYRHKEMENIEIHVGNFMDIYGNLEEKFDVITLIGVLEYADSYVGGEEPAKRFLNIVRTLLKPNGKIVIAIENKYGLKYWAGCKEDHLGMFYKGLEGYTKEDGVRTYARHELENIVNACGLEARFYYPYPDYKFPTMIYTEEYLPKTGELSNNIRNFDADRVINFDETRVFDHIVEDGLFPVFSNSFLLVLEEGK